MAAAYLTSATFNETIKSGFVFVDFWAEWCGPCRSAAPIIEDLSNEYAGKMTIAKLDVDAEPALAEKYGVMSIPTVILFKEGQEIGRQVGYAGREGYIQLLQKAGL